MDDRERLFPAASPIARGAAGDRMDQSSASGDALVRMLNASEAAASPRRGDSAAMLPGGNPAPSANLGALVAKVTVLQKQARDIEADKARLAEQRDFQREETARVQKLLDAAASELHDVKARVKELAVERERHVCAAPDAQYRELEQRTRELRGVRMRVERKEEHLNAVLGATRDVTAKLQALRDGDAMRIGADADAALVTPWRQRATTSSAGPEGSDDGAAREPSYVQLLLQRTGEQAVVLDRLRRAADSREKLEEEIEANERRIRQLRAKLEDAGAPVPEAPQMHRTKRLIKRAQLAAGIPAEGSSGALTPSTSVYSGSKVMTASGSDSRRIVLPVGTLRAVAQRAGYSTIRDLAKAHGVASLAVHVVDSATELHCAGTYAALDAFHAAVQQALENETATREIDGLLTARDPAMALAVDSAVSGLAEALPVDPPNMLKDAGRVRFAEAAMVDVESGSDDSDETS